MGTIWFGTSEDANYRYHITAQATSSTTAAINEMKTDKNTQQTTTTAYALTDVVVLNDQLKGTVHLPGFTSETLTLTRGPGNAETIATSGLLWGIGAQTYGPFLLTPADDAALAQWETDNF